METAFLTHLCRLAEPTLKEGFYGVKQISYKKPEQILTDSDLKVNELICNELVKKGISPSRILSEEMHTESLDSSSELWCLDPIDGTREFANGIPEFALSIGVMKGGRFVAGAVFNPIAPLLAVATETEGLFANEVASRPNPSAPLELLASRTEMEKGLFDKLSSLYPVRPIGSVAYKLALVATGFATATASYRPKNLWDVAGGFALLEAGGAVLRDFQGASLNGLLPDERIRRGIFAARPGLSGENTEKLFSAFLAGAPAPSS